MGEYYGNNDWRDYLAHYGVKGMKWRKHKYVSNTNGDYMYNTGRNLVTKDGRVLGGIRKEDIINRYGWRSKSVNANVGKHQINVYKNRKKSTGESYRGVYTSLGSTSKARTKRLGRLTITRDEDGTNIELKGRKKKSNKKSRVSKIINKISSKQVGKKLSRIAERTHHRKQVGVATGETYLWRMNSNKKRKR